MDESHLPNSKKMLKNIRNEYNTDGAHTQKYFHGNMFGFWGIDTNAQIVWLAMALYDDNESGNIRTRSLSFLNKVSNQLCFKDLYHYVRTERNYRST